MRHTLRLAAIAILAGGLFPLASPLSAACASSGDHAALVIDLEDEGDVLSYCVALDDDEASGIELIALAGEQFGLDYRLGYGGEAVCMLAGVGTEGDDCFAGYPDFWGYWQGDDSGGWTWSGTGGGSTSVEPGDVEGWSWGSGSDGSSHPRPPATRFEDVCEMGSDPSAPPRKDEKRTADESSPTPVSTGSHASSEPRAGTATASEAARPKREARGERRSERDGRVRVARFSRAEAALPTPEVTPSPGNLASDLRTENSWGEELTLVLVIAMIATGVVIDRRRRRNL